MNNFMFSITASPDTGSRPDPFAFLRQPFSLSFCAMFESALQQMHF